MTKSIFYFIIGLTLATNSYAASTSNPSLEEPALEEPATTVSETKEAVFFDYVPPARTKIWLRVLSILFVILGCVLEYMLYKQNKKIGWRLLSIFGGLFFGLMAVSFFVISLGSSQIKCTPQGLILPEKCDTEIQSFFDVLSFGQTRYLSPIPYDDIACVDAAIVRINQDITGLMFRIQKTSGKYYYINPSKTTLEDMNRLCSVLKEYNPNIQTEVPK